MRKILVTICLFVIAVNYVCAENNGFLITRQWKIVASMYQHGTFDVDNKKVKTLNDYVKPIELYITNINKNVFVQCEEVHLSLVFLKKGDHYMIGEGSFGFTGSRTGSILFLKNKTQPKRYDKIYCMDSSFKEIFIFHSFECYCYDNSTKQYVKQDYYEWLKDMKSVFVKQDKPEQDKPKQDKPKQDKPKQDRPKQDRPKQDRIIKKRYDFVSDKLVTSIVGEDKSITSYEESKLSFVLFEDYFTINVSGKNFRSYKIPLNEKIHVNMKGQFFDKIWATVYSGIYMKIGFEYNPLDTSENLVLIYSKVYENEFGEKYYGEEIIKEVYYLKRNIDDPYIFNFFIDNKSFFNFKTHSDK